MPITDKLKEPLIAVCSFDLKLTPWDPCWEQYKDEMVPTACGRPICKHHWLSHVILECRECVHGPSQHAREEETVRKAIAEFEKTKEEERRNKKS